MDRAEIVSDHERVSTPAGPVKDGKMPLVTYGEK
jgi:hypothetical protein